MMTLHIWLMLSITLLMIVLFLWGKWRSDVVALLVLSLLGLFHIIPTDKLLSGFSSTAVIAIIAVMIIAAALEQSGVLTGLSQWLLRRSHYRRRRIVLLLSLVAGGLAGILRSVGGFSLILPTLNRVSIILKTPKSKLLMPVGFCAIAGGMLTLIGSGPLLVLNDIFHSFNHNPHFMGMHLEPLRLFTVFPIGLAILVAIILFFWFVGRWLLPKTSSDRYHFGADAHRFRQTYGYGGKYYELLIPPDNNINKLSLHELETLLSDYKIAVVALSTGKENFLPPLRKTHFSPDTHIAVIGNREEIQTFADNFGLTLSKHLDQFADILNPVRSGLSEVVIPPGSDLIGKPMRDLHMRRNFNVQVLSVYRSDQMMIGEEMHNLTIRSGDTLGLFSTWRALAKLDNRPELAVVISDYPKEQGKREKRLPAVLWLVVSLLLIGVFHFGPAIGLIIGAAGVLLTRIVDVDKAYRSVSWRTVFLLAGLIPYGIAMQSTGTAGWLVNHILEVLHPALSPWVILMGLSIITSLFSLIMSNVGATVVMVPIAIQFALAVGADPRLFAIIIAISTSNAFLLPTHQVSTILTASGGYRPRHFLLIGGLVSIIYLIVMLAVSYWWLG